MTDLYVIIYIAVLILILILIYLRSKIQSVYSTVGGNKPLSPAMAVLQERIMQHIIQNAVISANINVKPGDVFDYCGLDCKITHTTVDTLHKIYAGNLFPFCKNKQDLYKFYDLDPKASTYRYIEFTYMDPEYLKNPHAAQRKFYAEKYGVKPVDGLEVHRILDLDTVKGVQYHSRKFEPKTIIHWGQRKLMLSEIEFMTAYADKSIPEVLLVYPGSAGGHHIPFMSELFPNVRFILYDPMPYAIKATKKIEIYNEYFTNESVAKIKKPAGARVLLVSDIRRHEVKNQNAEQVEETVAGDQELQKGWFYLLEPHAAMFKFRLPWNVPKTKYLDGKIYLPVWGPKSTTETRLWISGDAQEIEYDNKHYENAMFEYNIKDRTQLYKPICDVDSKENKEGFCRCYDCTAELKILRDYLVMKNGTCTDADVFNLAYEMSNHISGNRYHLYNYHKTIMNKKEYEDD